MSVAIGLDLGLDALRVAALVDDRVEAVATIPAVIGFANGQARIGAAAAALPAADRQDDLTAWLGRRSAGRDGDDGVAGVVWPMVARARRSPAELVGRLLRAGVYEVERRHGRAAGAVIAVPVELGAIERRVLRDAAAIAGLPAVRLIAAPAVAALAISDGQPARVLVVDAGAAALRVALVEHGDGAMDLVGYAVAVGAGGRAIDHALATQLAVESGRPVQTLLAIARRWKEGQPITGSLARIPRADELGLWITPSVRELDAAIAATLAAGAVTLDGVTHAFLVGDGARLTALANRFAARVGNLAWPVDDPSMLTARGAARAAQLFVDEPATVIVDEIPSSFALGAGSAMASMVPVGAIAPTREVRLIARDRPDRTAVEVELWEELPVPRPYGRYQIGGLPPGTGAIAACELTVDVDRIPRIDASDLVNGAALTVTPLLEVGLAADAVAALRDQLAAWTP